MGGDEVRMVLVEVTPDECDQCKAQRNQLSALEPECEITVAEESLKKKMVYENERSKDR
jgi:glutaredoxin